MAMTESAHITARPAPFGAITIHKIVSTLYAPLTKQRAVDMTDMSPATREDIGVTLRDLSVDEASLFSRPVRMIRDWVMHRRTVAQLSALSDRQLEDIGMTRADIHQI